MNFLNKAFNLCLIYEIIISVKCEHTLNANNLTADDFEKRTGVKEFFDSLVAGTNQNAKTSQSSMPSTPRPGGPIYMPFAVPVHSNPPPFPGPHVHIAPPPSFGYSSNINSIYRPPPPPLSSRPHIHLPTMAHSYGMPHNHHNHNHHHHSHPNHDNNNYSPLPLNQNFGSQSHHYPIPHPPHSHYEYGQQYGQPYGQHSRPIAIAIPLPLHAIPLHLIANNGENQKGNNFLQNPEFSEDMRATTKFTLFADPFEDVVDEDLFDNPNQRYKFMPIPKN